MRTPTHLDNTLMCNAIVAGYTREQKIAVTKKPELKSSARVLENSLDPNQQLLKVLV